MKKYQTLLGATLVAVSALVAGCGDKADTTAQPSASATEAKPAAQAPNDQQLVEKYNLYIDVSNNLRRQYTP